jgi:hypothetical protein
MGRSLPSGARGGVVCGIALLFAPAAVRAQGIYLPGGGAAVSGPAWCIR